MHVCLHACYASITMMCESCIHVCAYMHANVPAMLEHTHTLSHTHIHTHTHMCVFTSQSGHNIYTAMIFESCIYIYTNTYTHTYTCVLISGPPRGITYTHAHNITYIHANKYMHVAPMTKPPHTHMQIRSYTCMQINTCMSCVSLWVSTIVR